jgi:hypothetical protein
MQKRRFVAFLHSRRITNRTIVCVLIASLVWTHPHALVAQGPRNEQITAEMVITAIDRGVEYLKRQQDPRGYWSDLNLFAGGMTALSTLALLNSGVPPSDPAVQKALAYLRGLDSNKTYVVSLQTMVLAIAEPSSDLLKLQRNVRWLQDAQVTVGEYAGSWGYQQGSGDGDNSNSQFAVLALHEAERAGVTVEAIVWQRAHDYWVRTQNDDGSWGYKPRVGGTGSMTCAGIGALVITSGKLAASDAAVVGGDVQCCGAAANADQDALERGLAWLGRNFSVTGNPYPDADGNVSRWHYYYLYGLERVGRLSGRRLIGNRDWYREGAHHLVLEAKPPFQEFWAGDELESNRQLASALALLFLSKGRRPVVIAKAQHPPGADWNNHASDLANIVAYTERAWEMDLTWQIYDLPTASADDLLQAPVLFLSGSRRPEFAGQAQKLREYIDRGGMIFAEACCEDSADFQQGFRDLIEQVFPEPEYQLNRIGPQHPIWRAERLVRPESPYVEKLWAVEYGCRTCVVFSEADLSCYWSLYSLGRDQGYPPDVKAHVEDALTIGLNVLTYATGRKPKHKEENLNLQLDPESLAGLEGRGVIGVVKLQHGGGSNDAPGALANLLRTASQGELRLRVSPQQNIATITPENLKDVHLAFMHGRHDFKLSDQERTALREFLERGGTLLADAICASDAFAAAFRREMQAVFPQQPMKRINPDDPLFGPELGGFDIRTVERREPLAAGENAPLAARERSLPPELEGLELEGRWAVVFSPLDLSCALEAHESLQCRGYTRQDAARIALNVLVYSLNW